MIENKIPDLAGIFFYKNECTDSYYKTLIFTWNS
jgi:hypothetical protein